MSTKLKAAPAFTVEFSNLIAGADESNFFGEVAEEIRVEASLQNDFETAAADDEWHLIADQVVGRENF